MSPTVPTLFICLFGCLFVELNFSLVVIDTNDRFLRKITIGQSATEKNFTRQVLIFILVFNIILFVTLTSLYGQGSNWSWKTMENQNHFPGLESHGIWAWVVEILGKWLNLKLFFWDQQSKKYMYLDWMIIFTLFWKQLLDHRLWKT